MVNVGNLCLLLRLGRHTEASRAGVSIFIAASERHAPATSLVAITMRQSEARIRRRCYTLVIGF